MLTVSKWASAVIARMQHHLALNRASLSFCITESLWVFTEWMIFKDPEWNYITPEDKQEKYCNSIKKLNTNNMI